MNLTSYPFADGDSQPDVAMANREKLPLPLAMRSTHAQDNRRSPATRREFLKEVAAAPPPGAPCR